MSHINLNGQQFRSNRFSSIRRGTNTNQHDIWHCEFRIQNVTETRCNGSGNERCGRTLTQTHNAFIARTGAETPGATYPRRLNFVRWCQIFVGSQYGTSFMSPLWGLEFLSGLYPHIWNICGTKQVCMYNLHHKSPIRNVVKMGIAPKTSTQAKRITQT
jgi:hypothetical protein